MYNPFPLLNEDLLNNKIKSGKRYFVRQAFPRGKIQGDKAAFLVRAYEAAEEETARMHFNRLKHDPNAFFYDITNGRHQEKLCIAAKQPAGYKVYYAGKKGKEWKPPLQYQLKIRKYLGKKHPEWKTKSTDHKIEIGLYEEFGQLFLKFSFREEEDKVLFDEIEKY